MATTKESNTLSIIQKDTIDVVANRVREFQENGELFFPEGYSPENAMKAAWLTIQETVDRNKTPAIEACTKNSIANALLDMVVQGLNPMKKQCYFIVYGNRLVLQRSYFGSMHIAKSVNPNIEDFYSEVVYEGDKFSYTIHRGKTEIVCHEQTLENVDKNNIKAAYCCVIYKDGTEEATIMTMDEIMQAWRQSPTNPIDDKGCIKSTSTHGKFTADMAKKTVTNKACKKIINSSDDSNLIVKHYKNSDIEMVEAEAAQEISDNANQTPIEIPEAPTPADEQPATPPAPVDDLP